MLLLLRKMNEPAAVANALSPMTPVRLPAAAAALLVCEADCFSDEEVNFIRRRGFETILLRLLIRFPGKLTMASEK